ncbi:MAG: DUF481 domain-containing protein [Candidatus Jettenia sp.]|nr:MAG: DUF481 domain-containing protein [Candidatus Jettenia sp.]
MPKLRFLIFFLMYFCLINKAFTEEIKTIDGDIIKGEVVDADEECLSIRDEGGGAISFIQWRVISLISRDKEVIIVSHDETRRKFTILKTEGSLSAKDISLTTADTVSSIYPKEMIASRSFFTDGVEPSVQASTHDTPDVYAASQRQDTLQQGKPWKGNIDAGLTLQRGNRDALTTSVKTNFSLERMKDNFYFNSLLLFETTAGTKSADEQHGAFKYERKHKERLYSFHQESIEHDEIEKLSLRSITSSGMGYRFIERENLKYKSEIGPSYTYERFQDSMVRTSPGLRIGNYLDWQIFDSTFMYAKVDFIPAVDNLIQWRLESDVGLRQRLNKHISWNISWINQYDSDPSAEGVKNNDATILSTIGYNF